jgi:hypothetical protein
MLASILAFVAKYHYLQPLTLFHKNILRVYIYMYLCRAQAYMTIEESNRENDAF